MISLFKKKDPVIRQESNFLSVDIHSHLLPGIDDGCKNIEESISCIKNYVSLGYKKLITTPHIITGFYENTPDIIHTKLKEVKDRIEVENLPVHLEAAAEYYLDEHFIQLLDSGEKLLTFGKNYILIELGFYNQPVQLTSSIFSLLANGYTPVLAHPERYLYIYNQLDKLKEWTDKGLLLQINLLSLVGYYSTAAQAFCEKLIDEKMVSFAGTDAHNGKHLETLSNVFSSKYFTKLAENNILNNSLL